MERAVIAWLKTDSLLAMFNWAEWDTDDPVTQPRGVVNVTATGEDVGIQGPILLECDVDLEGKPQRGSQSQIAATMLAMLSGRDAIDHLNAQIPDGSLQIVGPAETARIEQIIDRDIRRRRYTFIFPAVWAVVDVTPIQATTYLLSGPVSGPINTPTTYMVQLPAGGYLPGAVRITPDDGAVGGVFTPSSVVLDSNNAEATFTYTPSTYGARTISTTNDGGLTDPPSINFLSLAIAYSLVGPTAGIIGTASSPFTVALPTGGVVNGTVIVTPHDGGAGGVFTPSSVALTTASPSAQFTYNAAVSTPVTISTTNSASMTDPPSLIYTAAYTVPLTINHLLAGTVNSTNFPVLFHAIDPSFKQVANGGHVANASGYDIRPYADLALTTPLSYQLRLYNPATGEVLMVIRIPTLSVTADTVIYLNCGDTTWVTDGSSTGVWNANFKGVYNA
jgi:hypothetical protein